MPELRFGRAAALTAVHELRLLRRDPVALLMMLLAPVIIITVAGYSLGALYGSAGPAWEIPVVDRDGGAVLQALRHDRDAGGGLKLRTETDLARARHELLASGNAPVVIEIPAGTQERMRHGENAPLVVYIDPARRLAVNAIELELAAAERRAATRVRARTNRDLLLAVRNARHQLREIAVTVRRQQRRLRNQLAKAESEGVAALQAQLKAALARSRHDTKAALHAAQARAGDDLRAQLEQRRAASQTVRRYLEEMAAVRPAFEHWFAELERLAGRHADQFPPPPTLPEPPAAAELAALSAPLSPPELQLQLPAFALPRHPAIAEQPVDDGALAVALSPPSLNAPRLPGALEIFEQSAIEGAAVKVNTFDQYVPGFGVTFLLIGMMMGVALTLYDEQEWGTLQRLQAAGASLPGILTGKASARVLVGVIQMIILFGIGRLLFGISLGHSPLSLLLPMIGMAIAAAALGLIIAALAPAHDSVMPLGTMVSLALAAIGGCWWPLDFEPDWMRRLAHLLPTTWTMQAFNDLMIRGAAGGAAVKPFLVTTVIGLTLLSVGIGLGMRKRA